MLPNSEKFDLSILLTLIVPYHNSEASLPFTIRSLSTACSLIASNDVEILFIDNGSTDGSRAIVDRFCHTRVNTRCISEPVLGVSSARNAGLESAHGEYIASVDSDDEIASGYLTTLLPVLRQAPDLVVLPFELKSHTKEVQFFDQRREVLDVILGWWCCQFVFRRALCRGLAFKGQCYEDFGFFPRILQRSESIAVLHGDIYHYRNNPNSLTSRSAVWRLAQLEAVGSDLLSDNALRDKSLVLRILKDYLRSRMQLRAIACLWPVLSLRDCVSLIVSSENRIRQVWQIVRLSASVLRRKILERE